MSPCVSHRGPMEGDVGVKNRKPGEMGRVRVGKGVGKRDVLGPLKGAQVGRCIEIIAPEGFNHKQIDVREVFKGGLGQGAEGRLLIPKGGNGAERERYLA